uniref:Uncharacterized protein n=1 Tax=Arundo donax TaxID=35708 RepID=A0A0A9B906_ARUDO
MALTSLTSQPAQACLSYRIGQPCKHSALYSVQFHNDMSSH